MYIAAAQIYSELALLYTKLTTGSLPTLIGVFVAAFALYQNNKSALERDKRKETRAYIDQILKDIRAIESEAVTFHTKQTFSIELNNSILRNISRLSSSVNRLAIVDKESALDALSNLSGAITLDNFDSSTFHKKDDDDELISRIFDSSQSLAKLVESSYFRRYPL